MLLKTRKYGALLLVIVVLATGCSAGQKTGTNLMEGVQAKTEAKPEAPGKDTADIIAGFSSRLFEASLRNEGSVMVSPVSVFFALAMALNGADGDTKEAMLDVLAKHNLTMEEINEACGGLLAMLQETEGMLAIANAIWFDENFQPYMPFLQVNADFYDAAARKLDFSSADAPDAINGWVNEATNGTIEKIIDQIGPDVVMYLINAVYFKADWEDQFEANDTADRLFERPEGKKMTPFMNRTDDMSYLELDGATGVLLPYEGGRYGFAAVLPPEGMTPRDWLASQNGSSVINLMNMVDESEIKHVKLALPKFESRYEDSLMDELDALGMGIAFRPGEADFSMMNESHAKDLFISEVKHKTFVKVDEEGTEASAVTSVEVSLTAMPMPVETIELTFDRPFVYCIIDMETLLPIFTGIMEDPTDD